MVVRDYFLSWELPRYYPSLPFHAIYRAIEAYGKGSSALNIAGLTPPLPCVARRPLRIFGEILTVNPAWATVVIPGT